MRVYVDEHIDQAIVDTLRRGGCDVARAVDRHPHEPDDDVHLREATREERLFMTRDDDFLKLHAEYLRLGHEHTGVVFWQQSKDLGIGYVTQKVLDYLHATTIEQRCNKVLFL